MICTAKATKRVMIAALAPDAIWMRDCTIRAPITMTQSKPNNGSATPLAMPATAKAANTTRFSTAFACARLIRQ